MSDANLRQIRVLHIVSAGGVASSAQQSLFMPLLTRLPRPRVKSQVVCLSPGAVPSAVLRQSGVPVFDLALSRKRFSPGAFKELVQAARLFRPDVIQAWGHTAQIISTFVRGRCDWKPRLIWSVVDTTPLAKNAGVLDRQKLKYAAKFSARADRIVYASGSSASQHRRIGFPDGEHVMIPPGVDATRFKPDFAARRKVREQLNLPGEAFVLGMVAPFQPENDHATLIKAAAELIKTHPNINLVLAGHGLQKGNGTLMALVGAGALSTRIHLLGEWSDMSALFNACDIVCSSALNDQARMNLVMAMLCGVPCVATGLGAQGEVIGQHGVALEPGSPAAFVKGVNRVLQLTPEKRTHMAQGARKHALDNYVYIRSLQKYLQLYYDMIGRQSLVTQDLPTPEVDATLTAPPALPTEAELTAAKRKPLRVADLSEPDSLEAKVAERQPDELPKWRLEQEQERSKREAEVAAKVATSKSVGDVLQVFESEIKPALAAASPMTERARGVADDSEELLSPDLLTAPAPPPRVSTAPPGARNKPSTPASTAASMQDTAKQAALKAARMAALQPIASKSKPATIKPAARGVHATAAVPAPVAALPATPDISSTQPLEMLSQAALMQPTSAPPAPVALPFAATPPPAESKLEKIDLGMTQPLEMLSEAAIMQPALASAAPSPVSVLPSAPPPAVTKVEKVDSATTQPLEMLAEAASMATVPAVAATIDVAATQLLKSQAEAPAVVTQPLASRAETPAVITQPAQSPADPAAVIAQPLQWQVEAALAIIRPRQSPVEIPVGIAPRVQSQAEASVAITRPRQTRVEIPVAVTQPPQSQAEAAVAATQPSPVQLTETPAASPVAATVASESSHDFSELSFMSTGAWVAMSRASADANAHVNDPGKDTGKTPVLNGEEALSLITGQASSSAPDATTSQLTLLPEPSAEPKRAANGD